MNRKVTLPIGEAQQIAKDLGDEALIDAIARLMEIGWDVLTLEAEMSADGWDVSVRPPTGVMVALMLPNYIAQDIAIPGGEPASDLHITLAYLGEASALSLDDQRKLIGVVGEIAVRHSAMEVSLSGVGRFETGEETEPFWVGVESEEVMTLHAELMTALQEAGLPVVEHDEGYTPHVTMAYLPTEQDSPAMEFQPMSVYFNEITVAVGPQRFGLTFLPRIQDAYDDEFPAEGWVPNTVSKSVDTELRYTFGPWYVPETVDAHNEWTDAKELQKTLWGYVRKGNRDIRLQHNTQIVAGEWVEAVTWPYEVTLPMTKADGTVQNHTFPANTPFLGVVWEPWSWELVKSGKLSGYSIGGKSSFLEADLGDGSSDDD